MKRDISLNPAVPELNDDLIALVSAVCFQPFDDRKSDALFVFGTWSSKHVLIDTIIKSLEKEIAPLVFINGGIPAFEKTGEDHISAADRIMAAINTGDYPNIQFIVENTAENTLEEVEKSLLLYDFSSLKTVSFIAKSHAATRQMLTLKRFLPWVTFRAIPYSPEYSDVDLENLNADNWFHDQGAIKRVWGQFLRIKKYGERGDIAYPPEIKEQIDYVISQTNYI